MKFKTVLGKVKAHVQFGKMNDNLIIASRNRNRVRKFTKSFRLINGVVDCVRDSHIRNTVRAAAGEQSVFAPSSQTGLFQVETTFAQLEVAEKIELGENGNRKYVPFESAVRYLFAYLHN